MLESAREGEQDLIEQAEQTKRDETVGTDVDADGDAHDPGTAACSETVGRGWVVPPAGSRVDALFIVTHQRLGIGRPDGSEDPVWIELSSITKVDAIGDPVDDLQEIELVRADGPSVSAGWTEKFAAAVIEALRCSLEHSGDPQGANGDIPIEATATEIQAMEEPAGQASPATETQAVEEPAGEASPAPQESHVLVPDEVTAGAVLELEDVTYIGGFPGESKKRKRCTASLSSDALEVKGQSSVHMRLAWDTVRTVEAQNCDEARFRTNTKIHPDSSALVFECEDGATVILEARDCPTIALRQALEELLQRVDVEVK